MVDPRRARLLAAAPAPEGDRGGARAGPPAGDARRARRRGRARCSSPRRYRSAGTVEFVLDVDTGDVPLPRGEHPAPGGAPRDRGGHRRSTSSSGWCALAAGDTAFTPDRAGRGHAPDGPRDRGPRLRGGSRAATSCPAPACSPKRRGRPSARVDTWVARRHRGHAVLRPAAGEGRRARADARRGRRRDRATRSTRTTVARHRDEPATSCASFVDSEFVPRRDRHHRDARRSIATPAAASTCSHRGRTTVQDLPGRLGYWARRRAAERADGRPLVPARRTASLGNPDGAPGLECTASGPTLRFAGAATICLTGARDGGDVDGEPVAVRGRRSASRAGPTLALGARAGPGLRTYLLVRGGFDVPVLSAGVDLHPRRLRRPRRPRRCAPATCCTSGPTTTAAASRAGDACDRPGPVPAAHRPSGSSRCSTARTPRPSSSPTADIDTFYATDWQVHHNSARTGRAPGRADARSGRAPTAARPGCTRRTSTTRLRRRRGRLHRRHADHARARRPEPRRLRVPGHRDQPPTAGSSGSCAPGDRVRFVPVDRAEARARATASRAELATRATPPVARAGTRGPAPTVLATACRTTATPRRSRTARQGDATCSSSTGR